MGRLNPRLHPEAQPTEGATSPGRGHVSARECRNAATPQRGHAGLVVAGGPARQGDGVRQGGGVRRRAGVRILKWASLVVVLVSVALVWTGAVDAGRAIGIVLAVDAVLWVLIAVLILGAVSGYRERRRDGMARREALALAARDVVPAPVLWILRHEASMITTWWLVVRRTRDVPAGAVPFSYGREQLPLFATIASVSVIEIVPIHLLVPWPWLRVVLLVLSVYGALWIVAFYQGFRRRPHYVTDDRMVLRCGTTATVEVAVAGHRASGAEGRALALLGSAPAERGSRGNQPLQRDECSTRPSTRNARRRPGSTTFRARSASHGRRCRCARVAADGPDVPGPRVGAGVAQLTSGEPRRCSNLIR